MIKNIFGHKIYVSQVKVNEAFEKYRTVFTKQIVNVSNYLPLIANREGRGDSRTTVARPDTLNRMVGYTALFKTLQPYLDEARAQLFPDNTTAKFALIRGWANVMHSGSSITSHAHRRISNNYMLCVFYLEAPEGSARFGIVNSEMYGLESHEYPADQIQWIPSFTDQLVCHVNDVTHVVEKHLHPDRRVAVILEMALVDENNQHIE